MADFDSSLPIRTQTNGDAAVKVVDGTVTSQALAVDSAGRVTIKLDDGSGNPITSQVNGSQRALDVGIDVAGVQIDPRQIRALTSADIVTAAQGAPNTLANGWPVEITDGTNKQAVKAASTAALATDPASVVSLSPNSPLPAGQTGIIGTVRLDDGAGNAVTSQVNGAQRALDVGINVAGVQIDPRQIRALTSADIVTANIKDSSGNAFSLTNPLPVTLDTTLGTSINDYKSAAAIASGATDNHDYTVTSGKSLYLDQIEASASGKMKIEVQVETGAATNVFVSRFVQFNSTATANMSIRLANPIIVAAGVRVRIICTNRDLAAENLYSTISGSEL